ncbi:UvrD-helicase domain-containing protein [Candidatus Nitrotoga fabula]|uniref:ATP-dependent DNA helicase Rep n=1 Tax=Candidatus Nitrotoga fabula TaxID=2182327 RepID=A0A916BHM1_9PROT|nr:UvrD-helicase domain-containing protein [Candidatus Nitrotoga fabula]CAE6734495.1 ATP-dependent DNA helicase Rep [Candidatus Nitrotoga fabula]
MLSKLNSSQREAVRYLDGPLLVLAGAGSGKTRVITHKLAYLIEQCGYAPHNIAAITFTNKAADEMRERVSRLMAGRSKGLTVSTFHALGMQILREESGLLGYKKQFSVFDSADTAKIISELLGAPDKQDIRIMQGALSRWKTSFILPEQANQLAETEVEQRNALLYTRYQETLRAYQAMDFDDLIRLPVALFQNFPEALQRWQQRFRYLLIDEYQDTNECQYQMARLLAGSRAALTAVGDDDQAIYAWRGASTANLQNLQNDHPNLRVIKLEQNYRSSQRILSCANHLIRNNSKLFEKRLWSEHGPGDPIRVFAARDDESEAESVVMRLLAHKFEHNTRYSDYAILYRSNHLSRPLEEQLRLQKVPYTVSGGSSFFDRAEIKDLTAYLRLIANTDDDPAFIRAITTPKRGIGNQTLEKLAGYAGTRNISLFAAAFETAMAHQIPARQYEELLTFCNFIHRMEARAGKEECAAVITDLMAAIDYEAWLFDSHEPRQAESKWANVADFVGWIKRKAEADSKTLLEMTQTIALMNLLESRTEEPDAVSLSTLHAAKGLEFGHVFMIGVEEGILPHRQSELPEQIEEERRLMYVGITRAERSLHLSYCTRRKHGKEWQACEPSRFLQELPADEIIHTGISQAGKAPEVSKDAGMAKLARLKAMLG